MHQIRFRVLDENPIDLVDSDDSDIVVTDERVLFEHIITGPEVEYKLAVGLYGVRDSITLSLEYS